jgi:CubicO group peptidase (beta-lactamase class C family)
MIEVNMMRAAHLFCCFACVLLSACGTLSAVVVDPVDLEPKAYSVSENLQAEVDSLVKPLIVQGQTPGMVVGVLLPDGRAQFFGYGTIDASTTATPDAQTLFAIGSLSKGFLGGMTELLVDEGVLSWDQTLAELLPPETRLSEDARRITLLQLATHTSGLPRQVFNTTTFQQFLGYLFTGESFYRQFDRKFILDYLAGFEADAEPGPKYSNIGYGLIGHILELHTGLSVDELLQRKLVEPLGLKCTGYAPEKLPCAHSRARGHAGDQPKFIRRGEHVPDWQFTRFMRGSAGLYSNASDLLSFARAHLQKSVQGPGQEHTGRLNAALADALQVRFQRPREAAAVAWVADDIAGQRITYQIGIVAGYTSYIGVDAERGTAVVVLQNSFNWGNSVGHKLLLRLAQEERGKLPGGVVRLAVGTEE